jgi:hypothetical protein
VAGKPSVREKSKWGQDHIPLPSGSFLHRPTLEAWNPRGCHQCGDTIFNIYPPGRGVSCPKCVRNPKDPETKEPYPVHGKFCMVTLKVVQVFEVREDDGNDSR